MPEQTHTPLPWIHTESENGWSHISSNPSAYGDIATTWSCGKIGVSENNAEFIVRACNAHYDLIEALETAAAVIDIIFDRTPIALKRFSGDWYAIELKIKKALATAKGEQT